MALSRAQRAFDEHLRRRLVGRMGDSPWPGLVTCVVLTVLARWVHSLPFPPFTLASGDHPVSTVLLGLLFGMVLRNVLPHGRWLKPGADVAVKRILPYGIILLGAGLDFYDLLRLGSRALAAAVVVIVAAIGLTIGLTRLLRVGTKLGLLIGVGTAICGSSAIVATAPVVEAEEEDLAYAVATINLFGMLAMLVFPALGALLKMQAEVYGAWCGLAIHATPQVVAAGFAHFLDGARAGEVATVVKLTRVSLLAPAVFVIGSLYSLQRGSDGSSLDRRIDYRKLVPTFVIWFLAMALLRTLGCLPQVTVHLTEQFPWGAGDYTFDLARLLYAAAKWIITGAMVGVGLSIELRAMKAVGARPVALGFLSAIIIAVGSLLLAGLAVGA